LVEEDIVGYG